MTVVCFLADLWWTGECPVCLQRSRIHLQRPHQAAGAFPPSPLQLHMAPWPVNPWKTCEVVALTGPFSLSLSLSVCRKIWPLRVAPGAEKTDCGLDKEGQIELWVNTAAMWASLSVVSSSFSFCRPAHQLDQLGFTAYTDKLFFPRSGQKQSLAECCIYQVLL